MSSEKYSRYEFLKTLGFKGSALMAILGSCTTKSDSVLNSLIVNNKGEIVAGLDSLKAAPIPVLPSYNPSGEIRELLQEMAPGLPQICLGRSLQQN